MLLARQSIRRTTVVADIACSFSEWPRRARPASVPCTALTGADSSLDLSQPTDAHMSHAGGSRNGFPGARGGWRGSSQVYSVAAWLCQRVQECIRRFEAEKPD